MKLKLIVFFFLLSLTIASAQKVYQANWDSLMTRPTPEWFRDAKFGIFIHWGVYSVPAFTKKGGYAEWYYRGYASKDSNSAVWKYHKNVWGENFTYQDFAPMFKAELFNPDEWASLFVNSGAKYIVLTSKHHDGFCLWPSKYKPGWNAMDVGPKRDLIGDLFTAVKKTNIKAGLYYSLPEWTNPIYKWTFDNDPQKLRSYIDDYMIPQIKELVDKYKPTVFWSDGEWDFSSKVFRSEEIVAWLYNNPNLSKDFVVNDRWGSDTRFRYGGFWATEYTKGLDNTEMPWEECRGMGASFGYNRNENIYDYQRPDSLIQMLATLVSNGGNLLLNIGPNADGTIPVIMQERLLQIGEWLRLNGKAIYDTRKWVHSSENENVRYTVNKDNKFVSAISFNWPGPILKLTNVKALPGSKIYLSGIDTPLKWKYNTESGLTIEIPEKFRNSFPGYLGSAYTVIIENGESNIALKPIIIAKGKSSVSKEAFMNSIKIEFTSKELNSKIYFTTDGTTPNQKSTLYKSPIILDKSATVKAASFVNGKVKSEIVKAEFIKQTPLPSYSIIGSENGLSYQIYKGSFDKLPDYSKIKPIKEGKTNSLDIHLENMKDEYSIRYLGYINIPTEDIYTFYLSSDDGSKVIIDDKFIVDNDGLHGAGKIVEEQIALTKGFHKIEIQFFEKGGDEALDLEWSSSSIKKQSVPKEYYYIQ